MISAEGGRVGRIDRTPRLVDVGDHPGAHGHALLLQHLGATGDDRLPQTDRLDVVLVVDEHGLDLLKRLVQIADREMLGTAPQETADVLAGELVVGIVATVVIRGESGGIRRRGGDGPLGLPALHQAAGLRVTAIDRLLQVLKRLLVLAERTLLLRCAEKRLAGTLHTLLAQVLVRGAVAQQLLGGRIVTFGVKELLLLQTGARSLNLTTGLNVTLPAAVGLGGNDVFQQFFLLLVGSGLAGHLQRLFLGNWSSLLPGSGSLFFCGRGIFLGGRSVFFRSRRGLFLGCRGIFFRNRRGLLLGGRGLFRRNRRGLLLGGRGLFLGSRSLLLGGWSLLLGSRGLFRRRRFVRNRSRFSRLRGLLSGRSL